MAYRFKAERNLSRQFRDFSMSMKANPNTEDFSVVKNENSIKQSMKNLVMTGFGERPFQPELGCGIRELLFENFDIFMLEELKEEIVNTLGRLEPRITVSQVNVNIDDDNNLEVEVEYVIIGERITQTVDFLLERT